MERRRFIAGAATAMTALLAGCEFPGGEGEGGEGGEGGGEEGGENGGEEGDVGGEEYDVGGEEDGRGW